MRPRTLDEVVGQPHLTGPGSPLRKLAEPTRADVACCSGARRAPARPRWPTWSARSPSGGSSSCRRSRPGQGGPGGDRGGPARAGPDRRRRRVLFIDEVHRFNKAQQDALLPAVENRWVSFIGATTENPSFSVVGPLLSRSLLLTLRAASDEDMRALLISRALTDERGLAGAVSLPRTPGTT